MVKSQVKDVDEKEQVRANDYKYHVPILYYIVVYVILYCVYLLYYMYILFYYKYNEQEGTPAKLWKSSIHPFCLHF